MDTPSNDSESSGFIPRLLANTAYKHQQESGTDFSETNINQNVLQVPPVGFGSCSVGPASDHPERSLQTPAAHGSLSCLLLSWRLSTVNLMSQAFTASP